MAETTTYDPKTGKWVTTESTPYTDSERKRYGFSGNSVDQRTANEIRKERATKTAGGVTEEELAQAEQDEYDRLMGLNNNSGGGGGAGYGGLLKSLRGLGNNAARGINSSMDELTRTLQSQANPYSNFQAQNTATTPALQQLLQSQGVSQDPLQQFATAINAQNTGQANAFQNQANTMRDMYTANQQGSINDVAAQRAQLLNSLQANTFGTGVALMGKSAPNRKAIMQMILEATKNGGMS
jgi:hypothetical protein